MIQKTLCSLSTEINFKRFYDMVKIRVLIISNVNFLIIYEILFRNIIKILPIIYKNKTAMPGKNRKCLIYS